MGNVIVIDMVLLRPIHTSVAVSARSPGKEYQGKQWFSPGPLVQRAGVVSLIVFFLSVCYSTAVLRTQDLKFARLGSKKWLESQYLRHQSLF